VAAESLAAIMPVFISDFSFCSKRKKNSTIMMQINGKGAAKAL
jgi:hypothetical protein